MPAIYAIPTTGASPAALPSVGNVGQIAPLRTESRQWSASLSHFREAHRPRRLHSSSSQRLGSASSLLRPPTSLFGSQGLESAARLPAVATHGGFADSRFASTGGFGSTAGSWQANRAVCSTATSAMNSATFGGSTSSGFWPSRARDRAEQGFSGLSREVEQENRRGCASMQCLDGLECGAPEFGDSSKFRIGSKSFSRPQLNMKDVGETADVLAKHISELRRRHEDFVEGRTPGGSRKKPGAMDSDARDVREERAARLLAYRMVKKVEPDIPIQREKGIDISEPRKEVGELEMHNASSEAIEMWSPDAKKKRRACQKEIREQRMRNALQISEDLKENRLRELVLMEASRGQAQQAAHCGREQRRQMGEKWITTIASASFLARIREEVSLRKMTTTDMVTYVGKHQERLTANGNESNFIKYALQLLHALQQPRTQEKFDAIAKRWRYRRAIQAKRHQAQKIFDCMMGWRCSGRVARSLLGYRNNIFFIQTWWRGRRKKLEEQRDEVAERWLKIERQIFGGQAFAEAKRGTALPKSPQAAPAPAPTSWSGVNSLLVRRGLRKHTASKSACAITISGTLNGLARHRFIERELRTRRFLLLPEIELWQEDRRAWLQEVDAWKASNAAHIALGKSADQPPVFSWPPVRPSFMPPRHMHGWLACPECCPGRRGDAQIEDMMRRARQDPNSWAKIPGKRMGAAAEKLARRSRGAKDPSSPSMSVYGPPPSTPDSKKLGAETDMPGVHNSRSMHGEAMHGGQAKAWLLQSASVMTMADVGFRPKTADEMLSPVGAGR